LKKRLKSRKLPKIALWIVPIVAGGKKMTELIILPDKEYDKFRGLIENGVAVVVKKSVLKETGDRRGRGERVSEGIRLWRGR